MLSTDNLKKVLSAHRGLAQSAISTAPRPRGWGKSSRLPVVFFSQVAWDTVWQRPQEQALGLSRYRPVVYVSPVQVHEYVGRLSERWEFVKRLNDDRLTVLTPIIFSGEYRSDLVRNWNHWLLVRLIRSVVKDDRYIYLTNTPLFPEATKELWPQKVVCDFIDDFAGFGWSPRDSRAWERALLRRVDLAFAGTGFLQRKFSESLPSIEYLSSGVRYEALTTSVQEPHDIASLPHPRVLYVGTLNDRLDGSLFLATSKAVAGGSVVVVGPRHETFKAPELPSNVHFLGLKPHTDLPGYYQHCDLGIMPFADNDAAKAINPIKTLEYLACGMPVLSTPVPDVIQYYDGLVTVAKASDWETTLREMLSRKDPDFPERARLFAKDRSWDALVNRMERQLRILERAP